MYHSQIFRRTRQIQYHRIPNSHVWWNNSSRTLPLMEFFSAVVATRSIWSKMLILTPVRPQSWQSLCAQVGHTSGIPSLLGVFLQLAYFYNWLYEVTWSPTPTYKTVMRHGPPVWSCPPVWWSRLLSPPVLPSTDRAAPDIRKSGFLSVHTTTCILHIRRSQRRGA